MKKLILYGLLVIILTDCSSQPTTEVKLAFKHYIYDKNCRVSIPEVKFDSSYYFFENNNLYSFNTERWCAVKDNVARMNMPDLDCNAYTIINDSIAVFNFINNYQILYHTNFRNGRLVKIDTITSSRYQRQIRLPKFKTSDFTGGIFVTNDTYLVCGQRANGGGMFIKVNLVTNDIDTVGSSFILENYTQVIKANGKFLVAFNGEFDVLNLLSNEHRRSDNQTNVSLNYILLDFINDDVVLLHHSKNPHQFALFNARTFKSTTFELDKNIFNEQNLRHEETIKVDDGPSDGINRQPFLYFAFRNAKDEVILSFADRQENRLFYFIHFQNSLLDKVN